MLYLVQKTYIILLNKDKMLTGVIFWTNKIIGVQTDKQKNRTTKKTQVDLY